MVEIIDYIEQRNATAAQSLYADLLRVHHERIGAWILEQTGIVFDAKAEPGKLQLVAG